MHTRFTDTPLDVICRGSVGDIPATIRVPSTRLVVIPYGWPGKRAGVYNGEYRDPVLSDRLVMRFGDAPANHDTVARIQAWLMDGGL